MRTDTCILSERMLDRLEFEISKEVPCIQQESIYSEKGYIPAEQLNQLSASAPGNSKTWNEAKHMLILFLLEAHDSELREIEYNKRFAEAWDAA